MRLPAGGLVMYVRGEAGRAGARSYPSTRSRQRLQGRDHQPPQRLRLGTPHLGFFLMLDLPRLLSSFWEIVYPYIPNPDGEDEGGQASSSLAVSTRWISTAKLLQSDLATLAQREGGEYEVVAKAAAYQP
ncbi:hypothetical protein B296_00041411 [Ensete ventricosum]|uniref:Uncharacterized protein n=1 Tax=Ensete ventricosum TaxID=4639 RepID=A0A426X199_ENSVE|nr:hypothetical protein B296_00041411 [Ensete ventricosum]